MKNSIFIPTLEPGKPRHRWLTALPKVSELGERVGLEFGTEPLGLAALYCLLVVMPNSRPVRCADLPNVLDHVLV